MVIDFFLNSNYQSLTSSLNASSEFNVLTRTVSKNCSRAFTKQDLSKSYSCQLNPLDFSATDPLKDVLKASTYESLKINLDVQYGPDATVPLVNTPSAYSNMFNKTQMVGDAVVKQKFVCPFIGNPAPLYYWRVVSVATNESTKMSKLRLLTPTETFSISDSQEFPIPADLQVGSYSFECKAKVQGIVMRESPVVSFNLNMIRN